MLNIYNRIYDKIQYKFSLIFSAIYVVLYNQEFNFKLLFPYLLLAICTALGIGGIGYLFNDFSDREEDKINNKQNIFNTSTPIVISLLTILLILFAILPWYFLPKDSFSWCLFFIELFLFYTYSFPPLRLKERGFLGIVADSLYAQVVPCIFAAYTFLLLQNNQKSITVVVGLFYILWLLLLGVRNIIWHQLSDSQNDEIAQIKTFVLKTGTDKAKKIIRVILVAEMLTFLLILFLLISKILLVLLFITYAILLVVLNKKIFQANKLEFISNRILNEFYEITLPLLLLSYFISYNDEFIALFLFHLILFAPIYLKFVLNFYRKYL